MHPAVDARRLLESGSSRLRALSESGCCEAGRVVVPIQPVAAPRPPRQEHRRPRLLAVESTTAADQPHRSPVGCEMDDHQDHAEDPDRRMTQDLDAMKCEVPEAPPWQPCSQQKGAEEYR
jgi:hypothetical protein